MTEFFNVSAAESNGYELTETGKEKCHQYITEMQAKRKEILDAGKDTADETKIPTEGEILDDLLSFGIDVNGEIFDCFGVTDNYNADSVITLTLGVDFKEVA